jgi:hypothetical protein
LGGTSPIRLDCMATGCNVKSCSNWASEVAGQSLQAAMGWGGAADDFMLESTNAAIVTR